MSMFRTELAKRICVANNLFGDPTEFGTDECYIDDCLSNLQDLNSILSDYVLSTRNAKLIGDFIMEYKGALGDWYSMGEIKAYIEYIKEWCEEHKTPEFDGMCPSLIEEYLKVDLPEILGKKRMVYCYYELKTYSSKKEAIKFFTEACGFCDPNSSEYQRYVAILSDLKADYLIASDEML